MRVLFNKVLVEKAEERVSGSGIVVAQVGSSKVHRGRVISFGPDIKTNLKPGDVVCYPSTASLVVTDYGILVDENSLLYVE